MSTNHLPKIDSIDELAQFWDTHDLTDFDAELEEVPEQVFGRGATITVHLQPNEAAAVRQMASSEGLAEGELVRTWVLEKLHSP